MLFTLITGGYSGCDSFWSPGVIWVTAGVTLGSCVLEQVRAFGKELEFGYIMSTGFPLRSSDSYLKAWGLLFLRHKLLWFEEANVPIVLFLHLQKHADKSNKTKLKGRPWFEWITWTRFKPASLKFLCAVCIIDIFMAVILFFNSWIISQLQIPLKAGLHYTLDSTQDVWYKQTTICSL